MRIVRSLAALRAVVERGDWVVLDTETTGLSCDSEAVQICVLAPDGAVLLDTFVRPTAPIPPDAIAIHGITDAMVADAPTIAEVGDVLVDLLRDKHVVVYNAEYDLGILQASSRLRGLTHDWPRAPAAWVCAMLAYAERRRVPGRYPGQYRWHKLTVAARHEQIEVDGAHNALSDCRTTLALVMLMAAAP